METILTITPPLKAQLCIADATADRRSRMDSDMFGAKLSAQIRNKELLKTKTQNILQLPDLKPTEHASHLRSN